MPAITQNYVDSLPEIYQDILRSVPRYVSQFEIGGGIAVASLAAVLGDKYSYSEIRLACERMANAGVLSRQSEQLFVPTNLGGRLVELLAVGTLPEQTVPEFPLPPDMQDE